MRKCHLSIIVPIYKVEQFLPECIESILAQTYQDWECILVDDGSPDNSGKIADEYAKRDSRIKVFHRQNRGVSVARNYGIDQASGEWIMFMDSDDVLVPDFIHNLYQEIVNRNEVQYVDAGCSWFVDKADNIVKVRSSQPSVGSDSIYLWQHYRGPVWAKLFKRDIITRNSIAFVQDMKKDEDVIFSLEYIAHVKHYVFSSEVGYLYRQNPNGAMATVDRDYKTCYQTYRRQNYAIDKFYELQHLTPEQCGEGYRMRASCMLWTLECLHAEQKSHKRRLEIMRNDYNDDDYATMAYYYGRWDNRLASKLLLHKWLCLYDFTISAILGGRSLMRRIMKR